METQKEKHPQIPLSMAAIFVALGVVYGDIGTSPLYVMKAIVAGNGGLASLSDSFIIGALSLVIWTVTLLTTIKYVMVAMQADNHGEGGIFSLYALVHRRAKWLIIPAMIGGAALLADGILTPAVTVTSAVEGLRSIPVFDGLLGEGQGAILAITLTIISALFIIQRLGTKAIGKAFGPIMALWFSFIGLLGLWQVFSNPIVLLAFNPMRGINLLFSEQNNAGFMILGSVFLATTGAEALYSDMGHVGRKNIYGSWPFVKITLLLNYLGQGAWLMHANSNAALLHIEDFNPFFEMMPSWLRLFAVLLSTMAAIIASQALITGSYTLVSEAISLNLLPHLKIQYPSQTKGQMYIPLVNNILWLACLGVVLYFRTSSRMEAAYGLAITVTMLMTTILLFEFLRMKNVRFALSLFMFVFFGTLETTFFVSSATKFSHGGYVAALLAFLLFIVMFVWYKGNKIENWQRFEYPMSDFINQFRKLKEDDSLPVFANNLVFLTSNQNPGSVDRDILYSILDKRPKRADVYWFINVAVTDQPYTQEYKVVDYGTDFCFKVQLRLGFKIEQRINIYLRQIIQEMMEEGRIKPQRQAYTIYQEKEIGDFCFVLIRKAISPESNLTIFERLIMSTKYNIKTLTGSPAKWFGLENTNLIIEQVPLFLKVRKANHLTRVD
ncbi:potassium transporter [Trichococcus palustris]|uniref:Probable potassium transport system protein Kup n=2 Tax=Trichococcus palustris TaxID=140314 RepID=A0A143YY43_9LACT|nr:potassium transporter [Trichococcus palustris]SFK89768.1 KUP system potassium uptake protein [Trichococcus palustris]